MYLKASKKIGRLSGTPGEHAGDFQFYLDAAKASLDRKSRDCESDMLRVFEAERNFARAQISLTYTAGNPDYDGSKMRRALDEFERRLGAAEDKALTCVKKNRRARRKR